MDESKEIKINVYTTFYYDKNIERHNEYLQTVTKNIDNEDIQLIVFLIEPNVILPFKSEKIKTVEVKSRPTYIEFIEAIHDFSNDDEYNIIAVTDIYFDKSIRKLDFVKWDNEKTAVCLTRWDIIDESTCRFFNKYYSNDTWIFKGKPDRLNSDFYLGQPGCDNRFNYDLYNAGYKVLNPSLSIATWHLHISSIRSYVSNPNAHPKTEKPYLFILPDFLDGVKNEDKMKIKLYRHIRYELYKEILFNRIEKEVYLQVSKNKINAFLKCILYFNYSRRSLLDVRFHIKDVFIS